MASLNYVKLKVGRAQIHLDALITEVNTFTNGKPYAFSEYDDLEHQRYVRKYTIHDVPAPAALIAGDFVHCLRSALDHIAWQLALLEVDAPYDLTCFPIVSDWKDPESRKKFKRSIKSIATDAVITEIHAVQPYSRGAAFKDHPLWQLQKLSNTDKHRRIPVSGVAITIIFPKESGATFEARNDGGVMSMPLAHKAKMQLAPDPPVKVLFGDTVHSPIELSSLAAIQNFVRDDVVPRFDRFFSEPVRP
jgi:hypothetical protein